MIDNLNIQFYCNNFYGYGNWEHPFWIMGLEEAMGNNINNLNSVVDIKINRFIENGYTNAELIDMHLFQGGIVDGNFGLLDNFFNPTLPDFTIQRYWKRGLQLIYAYENGLNTINGIGINHLPGIIQDRLGRNLLGLHNGISLVELFPLPLPSHNENSYNNFYSAPTPPHTFTNIGPLVNWAQYVQFVNGVRIPFILNKINTYKPRFIFMMGINDYQIIIDSLINHFGAILTTFTVNDLHFNILNITWPNGLITKIIHCNQPNGAWNNDYWNTILNQM